MTDTQVLDIATKTITIALQLSGPLLAAALSVGFAVSLLQSMTQVQEFTLAFVPKVTAVGATLVASGNWMLHTMIDFTQQLFAMIPSLLQ